jgi:hypothetical protein
MMTAAALNKCVQPRSNRGDQKLQRNLQRNQNLKATRLHALWAKRDQTTDLGPDQFRNSNDFCKLSIRIVPAFPRKS